MQVKTAEQQHTEKVTVNPCQRTRWCNRQRDSAPGPLCDLRRACSDADMELMKTVRVCHSSRIAASCCQPSLTIPGSCSSGSLVCGRRPSANARHPGGSNPCPQIGRRRIAFEFSNDPVRDFWMTLLDHSQRICPNRDQHLPTQEATSLNCMRWHCTHLGPPSKSRTCKSTEVSDQRKLACADAQCNNKAHAL